VQVVATAGHVDHGKSTLIRALTGMEPDRLAEEQRRAMTIDLGFAWATLPSGEVVAFVDVPGHERFVSNMLAGVGPAPAAMIVVAADEGWKPQSAEHLAALDALGVRYGLLVVTRSDLADPWAAAVDAHARIARTSLGAVETVVVSGVTGEGLDELRAALDRLVARMPPPDLAAPVRLWIDRAFTIRGSGTVVTGTLGAGVVHLGDELEFSGTGKPVRVRGMQSLGVAAESVSAVARVALNLRGVPREQIRRGDALVTPGRFWFTDVVDIRCHGDPVADLPSTVTLHIGSAAVPVRVRPLGVDTARLRLARALPLWIGDRALLRDPGRHHIFGGITVLDVDPPPLTRRGAAAARAAVLEGMDGRADETAEVRRRGLIRRGDLVRMGVPVSGTPVAGDWLVDSKRWEAWRRRLGDEVEQWGREHPLDPGAPVEALRQALGLPDRALVEALVTPPLVARGGRVHREGQGALPAPVAAAVEQIRRDLADQPFQAPEAGRLAQLGLGPREIGAAVRVGALVALADNVVLLPDAFDKALEVLAGLPQPFTASEARKALGTSRRVVVPLLEWLDRQGKTRRLPDSRRVVIRFTGAGDG